MLSSWHEFDKISKRFISKAKQNADVGFSLTDLSHGVLEMKIRDKNMKHGIELMTNHCK